MIGEPNVNWRPMTRSDLDEVNCIADEVHTGLPERPEVFKEKFVLFPQGCRILSSGNRVIGYGISHPWKLRSIPPLDEFLGVLPDAPNCIFVHDVVVVQAERVRGAAKHFISEIESLALQRKIGALALVSVYGTTPIWARCGFSIDDDLDLRTKLTKYGDDARYMTSAVI